MSKATVDYWTECVSQSLEEHRVVATPEQIEAIARDIESGHENYGQAFYQPPASDQHNYEMLKLRQQFAIDLAAVERREKAYKLEACRIARVDPKDVSIDQDGFVVRRAR